MRKEDLVVLVGDDRGVKICLPAAFKTLHIDLKKETWRPDSRENCKSLNIGQHRKYRRNNPNESSQTIIGVYDITYLPHLNLMVNDAIAYAIKPTRLVMDLMSHELEERGSNEAGGY